MPADFWRLLVLAVVQGLTEFLPVSSSGHLVLTGNWLALESLPLADVNIALHVATLGSVLAIYAGRIADIVRRERRLVPLLVVGSLPAVAIGLPVELFAKSWLESAPLAATLLIVNAGILWLVGRLPRGELLLSELGWRDALLIGLAQAFALAPGISRSGSTIAAGLARRLLPREAAAFSFLLAIPAILGAGSLAALKRLGEREASGLPAAWVLLAGIVAFLTGWLALKWLLRWLEQGRFQHFAWWCLAVSAAYFISRLFR